MDQSKQVLDYYASASGCSTKAYLKRAYGSNMSEKTFDEMLTMCLVADSHQADYLDSLTYTDAELEAYYQSDKECFTFADVEYIFFNGVGVTTTDADGNTVTPTDAENAEAAAAAKAAADDAAQRYSLGESLEDIAADYEEIAEYVHNTEMTSAGSEVTDWAFDAARVEGDTAVLDSNGSQYFVLFHSCGRPEYYTANVRHILFNADTSALDATSATYDADVEAVWAEARAKAQDALDQWNSGEKTAESFGALANELTDDTGSATTGGLYSDIAKGSSYVPSFKNWCFEEGRKVGDTGIVESTYGCHVMYLDSFSDTLYWKQLVQSEMLDADYADWVAGVTADTVVEEGSGMKYVG